MKIKFKLKIFRNTSKLCFIFLCLGLLSLINASNKIPKWVKLPFDHSRIEGIGKTEVTAFKTYDDAVTTADERARAELASYFRTNIKFQRKIGLESEDDLERWTTLILEKSYIADNWFGKIEGREMVFSYAVVDKAELINYSPLKASALSLVIPGLGQFYDEKPIKGKIILISELTLLGSALITYFLKSEADKNMDEAVNMSVRESYYDDSKYYHKLNQGILITAGLLWIYNVADAYMSIPTSRSP